MKTITVFCKDYSGLIADISELLGDNQINISFIQAEQVGENAIISLETSDSERTISLLNEKNFPAMGREFVLVKLLDEPGELARISRILVRAEIEIRSINMIQNSGGFNIVAINTNDDEKTRVILADELIN